jgi:hypothetical protein
MAEVLDAGTTKYLDTKFKNLDDKLDKLVVSVERIDGKVEDHSIRLSLVEKSHNEHIESHNRNDDKKESKKQFGISQWIAVILVILAILSDKFL